MEEVEMEESTFSNESNDDICNSFLSRFSNSTAANHQHLCAVIGAMSQELKDHNLSSSPVAYFCATCSSLDRIAQEPNPPIHLIDALLTILSIVIVKVPVAVLKEKREFLSELVAKVVMLPSSLESGVVHGLKCVSYLLIHRDSVHWSDVSTLFNFLLVFLTDSRPKVTIREFQIFYLIGFCL
jgi:ribosomal RNA-processing protein 12